MKQSPASNRSQKVKAAEKLEKLCAGEYKKAMLALNAADPLGSGYPTLLSEALHQAAMLIDAREQLRLTLAALEVQVEA